MPASALFLSAALALGMVTCTGRRRGRRVKDTLAAVDCADVRWPASTPAL